jgi:hypothetical protein
MSQIDVSLSVHVTSASAKLSPFLRQQLVGTNYHLWEARLIHPCGPASPDFRYPVSEFPLPFPPLEYGLHHSSRVWPQPRLWISRVLGSLARPPPHAIDVHSGYAEVTLRTELIAHCRQFCSTTYGPSPCFRSLRPIATALVSCHTNTPSPSANTTSSTAQSYIRAATYRLFTPRSISSV